MTGTDGTFFNLHDLSQGIQRELAPGITTRVFPGDQAMLSVVRLDPNAVGTMHHHPEEQWGVLLEGSAVRVQGEKEYEVSAGDFWRTPGGVPTHHPRRAGGRNHPRCLQPAPTGLYKTGFGIQRRRLIQSLRHFSKGLPCPSSITAGVSRPFPPTRLSNGGDIPPAIASDCMNREQAMSGAINPIAPGHDAVRPGPHRAVHGGRQQRHPRRGADGATGRSAGHRCRRLRRHRPLGRIADGGAPWHAVSPVS